MTPPRQIQAFEGQAGQWDTLGSPFMRLTGRIWPEDITVDLGRADFLGRWVKWKGI